MQSISSCDSQYLHLCQTEPAVKESTDINREMLSQIAGHGILSQSELSKQGFKFIPSADQDTHSSNQIFLNQINKNNHPLTLEPDESQRKQISFVVHDPASGILRLSAERPPDTFESSTGSRCS